MKLILLLLIISNGALAIEIKGHLQETKAGWVISAVDKSASRSPGYLCLHPDFNGLKNLYVKAKIKDKSKGKCFEVETIEPTVLDPLGGSLKPFRKHK